MRSTSPLGLAGCTQEELAILVREYLLAGHLIDRAGMPQVMAHVGTDSFGGVAIEEWMGASPVYTKRMQRALRFEGDSVETIFKGMQFDIGAPPQFMDFRYELHDRDHGEFWLDHCGALADVEPMGESFVVTMCHDIEDPTFDATAIASNPRARVRPVHRPPRTPADRVPVCHWTVTIADEHDPLPVPAEAIAIGATRAATIELSPIDFDEPGFASYDGPLLADLRFEDWSRSGLLRVAEEICLQGHLLTLSFLAALGRRTTPEVTAQIGRQQLAGVGGLVAERLRVALGLGRDLDALARVLSLHPAFLPQQYVGCEVSLTDRLVLRLPAATAGMLDGAWPALLTNDHLHPLDAIVRAIDSRHRCEAIGGDGDGLTVEVVMDDVPAPLADEVALARISSGTEFEFRDRGTPVEVRAR